VTGQRASTSFHRNLAFDTIDHISRLNVLEQVAAAFVGAMEKIGFAALGINGLPPPGKGVDLRILTESTPVGFRDLYIHEQFYSVDHICAHARAASEPFRYSEAPYERNESRGHERFMQALETFGMGKGLVVPVGRLANVPACVWLAGKNPDLDEGTNHATEMIALFATSKAHVLSHPSDIGARTSKLTPREREVLTWVAQGKSAWEIGEILSIAKRTVDEHAQTATRKLGAITRTQAVVNAIRIGEIKL
jgi:LuxR family transcriptional regulator, quorum-sensing system regulator BjaR1